MKITNHTKKSIAKAVLAISTIILIVGMITAISLPVSAVGVEVDDVEFTYSTSTIHTVAGKFHHSLDVTNYLGEPETLYQFRSYDDEVWWHLTEEEIGHIPNFEFEDTTYYLTYNDMGTTECDCPPEYDCDCYLYDDEFISCELEPKIANIIHYISYILAIKFN